MNASATSISPTALESVARFRVNYFYQHLGPAAVMRIIPERILTLDELKTPEVVGNFANFTSGLVLVTGPTGSGKSTTLAAIIDKINTERGLHIVTIEDPIEFVHPPQEVDALPARGRPTYAELRRSVARLDPAEPRCRVGGRNA